MYGTMICTLVALLAAVLYVDRMIIGKYHEMESQITRLLLSVPRSTASHIVTDLEEALEAFREVTEVDSTTVEQQRLAAMGGGTGSHSSHGSGRRGGVTRRRKFQMIAGVLVALIAGVTVGMYAVTLSYVSDCFFFGHGSTGASQGDDPLFFVQTM
ncbi:hypothetical protein BC828DRAFT_21612 [Blastocladiella britannica]|nr:hypothetical protein BC828DRAFT_21612 [Blastocladiella britannica]